MSVSASVDLHTHIGDAEPVAPPIRVLILSAIRFYRDGIAQALRSEKAIDVIGATADPIEAVAQLAESGPAVVLLDVEVPGSAALVRRMVETAPGTKVLALALDEEEDVVLACAEAGIAGYVASDASLADLVAAVCDAVRGEVTCPPRITGSLFRRVAALARDRRGTALDALTPREREVLCLICEGLSNKAIARQLGIEMPTTKNHVHRVLKKLGVGRRDAAAAWVHRLELYGEARRPPL